MSDWRNQQYDLPKSVPTSGEGEDAKWVLVGLTVIGGFAASVLGLVYFLFF